MNHRCVDYRDTVTFLLNFSFFPYECLPDLISYIAGKGTLYWTGFLEYTYLQYLSFSLNRTEAAASFFLEFISL